ncbi:MAG: TetR/AcrR family transcriptional regulator [Thermoanaerobaculales bacterium]
MNFSTRDRLIQAASRLFAENGYRGASVRDICNHAGANPGAISYHFGGKRQLYRTVLRQAAAGLAELGPTPDAEPDDLEPVGLLTAVRRVFAHMEEDDTAFRLLLRDLADGGAMAVESLAPPLHSAFEVLATALGHSDNPGTSTEGRLLLLELAAPLFLLTAAWPVLARALDLGPEQRQPLLDEMITRTLGAHGRDELL